MTLTATVTVNSPGTGTPGGTVDFMYGSTNLGHGNAFVTGITSVTTSALPVGNGHDFDGLLGRYRLFRPDLDRLGHRRPGVVNDHAHNFEHDSQRDPTGHLDSHGDGRQPRGGTPTGTVEFLNNGTSIGTGTLSAGTATFTTTLPIAANSITATYLGDTNFSSSTSTAVTVSVGTPNDEWLNEVFEILLNRPITAAEIPYWNKQFAKRRSRFSIANEISKGKEAKHSRRAGRVLRIPWAARNPSTARRRGENRRR